MTAADCSEIIADCNRCLGELRAIKALRPPCPTCARYCADRGLEFDHIIDCPDCVDGKVSIEQLVATYNAVQHEWAAEQVDPSDSTEPRKTLDYLRSVKP